MEEKENIKLSYESDGKMNKRANKSTKKPRGQEKEFFNTTQNSE